MAGCPGAGIFWGIDCIDMKTIARRIKAPPRRQVILRFYDNGTMPIVLYRLARISRRTIQEYSQLLRILVL
ncbi:MAG TPA: hypothetical protein VKI62_04265, partial [Bacteroidota bacterium]|nr:hypothetical protein [Bacteroidota bacterium]